MEDDQSRYDSCFSEIILLFLERRMNLMFSELMQIHIDIRDKGHYDLIVSVLTEISEGKIKSVHFTPTAARKSLEIYKNIK